MIPIKYAYLTGCLLFLVIWAILFWRRPDLRRAMLLMSLIGGTVSSVMAYYWTTDWWRPVSLTGTRIGLEDFLLGFSNAGIATSLYVEIFHKRFAKLRSAQHTLSFLILTVSSYILFGFLFYALKFDSATSTFIMMGSYSAALLYLRRDLFLHTFINGILMGIMVVPFYFLAIILVPSFISSVYIFQPHPNVTVHGVPLQEFIFYFAFGFMIPLMYEYWHGLQLRSMRFSKQNRRR